MSFIALSTRKWSYLQLSLLFLFWQITDYNNIRYEVSHENIRLVDGTADASNLTYYVEVTDKPFSIKIMRTSNRRVLWAFQPSWCIFEHTVLILLILIYCGWAVKYLSTTRENVWISEKCQRACCKITVLAYHARKTEY